MTVGRRSTGVVVLVVGLLAGAGGPAAAQLLPDGQSGQSEQSDPPPITLLPTTTTTSTTTTQPTTETTDLTAPPSSDTAPSTEQPAAPGSDGRPIGDGEAVVDGGVLGRVVPPEAQAFINSIARTPPNDTAAIVARVQGLVDGGMDPAQAARVGYGRFPIAGYASWSDDWLFPRWTGLLFRYHEGCDVFAAFGTPVRAPVDGVARIKTSTLGGLTISVYQPDGTFFYLAHLSGIADGLVDGQSVSTGDVVGFVGNSGNAAGGPPHLHFGIYPQGGGAVPPKPYLDQWVADALASLPSVVTTHEAAQPRALVATALVRTLSAGAPAGRGEGAIAPTELLWASAASPAGGGLRLAEARAAEAAASVDWQARALRQQALDAAWEQSAARARAALGRLTTPGLVRASTARRQAAIEASAAAQ